MDRKRKQYDSVDLGKLILSVLVCCIHTLGGIYSGLAPWTRVAVPVFFCLSGYFFFIKWSADPSFMRTYLPYAKRILILYGLWLLILWPIALSTYRFFSKGILNDIVLIIVRFFFGGLFASSWYLMATVIGVGLVCFADRKIPDAVLVLMGLVIYVICVLCSNYRGLFSDDGFFLRLFVYLYPGTIYHSFPVGLFFIVVGKVLAGRELSSDGAKWGG